MRIVHYNTDKKKVQNARKERRKEREKLGGMYVMRKNLKEARQKAGMHREQTTIRLPDEMKKGLQKEADKRGMSFNQLVLIILKEWVSRKK